VGYEQAAAQGQPPLTPEYQAIYEANLKIRPRAARAPKTPTFICIPDGMPRAMNVIFPWRSSSSQDHAHDDRISEHAAPRLHRRTRLARGCRASFMGYSIANGATRTGDGRYALLEIETRT